jgi:predicted nucleic acid-binding protein
VTRTLLDTGPLVALLNRSDGHHEWSREVLRRIRPPLFTCEAVLSEACFLVRKLRGGPDAVLGLVVTMSLADACLVRMTELAENPTVLTLDRDFRIYRRHSRQVIPVVAPEET